MKIDGVDPVHFNKVQDQSNKPVVQEAQRQNPRQKQQDKVLGREEKVLEADQSQIEELEEAVEKANATAQTFNAGLDFVIHEDSERMMVQVVDRVEDEVVKELPPEKLLNMVAQIQNIIGVFLDTRR